MMALIITISVFTSLAATTTVAAHTTTTTKITASNSYPAVGQTVTLTGTLKAGTTLLSGKSVTIYHYFGGVKYIDPTKTTNAAGQITLTQTFGSTGQRQYYASFAGDGGYSHSVSTALKINVGSGSQTTTTTKITASNSYPAVGQTVTLTGTLKAGTTLLSGKSVTIYHYLNGKRYNDTKKTTNANGQITFTQSFSSAGQRIYYAKFAGDTKYTASAGTVTVNVKTKTPTTLTFGGQRIINYYDPLTHLIRREVFATGHLKNTASGKPITGVKVTVEHLVDSTWTYLGSGVTNSTGFYMVRMTATGDYRAHFLGSTLYAPSWSTVQRMTMPPYR